MIVRMSTQASHTTRSWYAQSNRPSIGQPLDFRRVEGVDVPQRDSYRPLELSICLPDGRLSPLPDFSGDVSDTAAELQMPQKALLRSRAESVLSTGGSSHFTIQRKPVSSAYVQEDGQSVRSSVICGPTHTETKSRDASHNRSASVQSSPALYSSRSYSPHRLSSIGSRTTSSSNRPRALTEPRRAKMDVEEAISELNTIVEERRADALRNSNGSARLSSTTEHIPAIAPGMKVHARSETLSEIGSAFSLPLAMKPLPAVPHSLTSTSSATSAENGSTPSKKPKEPRAMSDLRPKSAPARDERSTKPKPALAVSVRAMCEEIEATKLSQRSPKVDTSAPLLSAPSVISASLPQRLNAWLRRSLPSSPTAPTTKMTYPDSTPNTNIPAKSAFIAATTTIPPVPPPPSSSLPPIPTTPPRQPTPTMMTNTSISTKTNNTSFYSSPIFSSPSARSTPSLASSGSSFSTATVGAGSKYGTEIVAETEGAADSRVKTRSVSRSGSSVITSVSGFEFDGENESPSSRRLIKPFADRPVAVSSAPVPMSMPVQVASTLSSLMSPPAYQEMDPHPTTPVSPVVGLAL